VSRRRWLYLALVVPLALAACGSNNDDDDGLSDSSGATHIPVTISDDGCDPAAITTKAGKVAFDVTNDGSASVTEFYVLKPNDDIVGEVENVIPGSPRTLTLNLKAGEYQTKCPNGEPEKGTLTVTES
jgi:iron uptake system component EfeO